MPSESRLYIVGIGPGGRDQLTQRAAEVLGKVENVVGYGPYVDLVRDLLREKEVASTGMGREVERAKMAVDLLVEGSVAFISSGDPNVYGMAGLGLEVASERVGLDRVEVVPGVTSFSAAACRAGIVFKDSVAVVSLSDLLTPWTEIESRVRAAAEMGTPLAIYNPRSRRRNWQLDRVLEILVQNGRKDEPLLVARNVSREGEEIFWTTVGEMLEQEHLREKVDMFTLVIVAGEGTFLGRSSSNSRINLVGTGPGDPAHLTLEARRLLRESDLVLGAKRYLEGLSGLVRGDVLIHKGRCEERMKARQEAAEAAAGQGKTASILAGGDPSLFGSAWRVMAGGGIHVAPGVSAFSAVASRLGAPLVNDFALLSGMKEETSDQVLRLMESGFGVVVYNLGTEKLADIAEKIEGIDRPCALAQDVYRPREKVAVGMASEMFNPKFEGKRCTLMLAGPRSYIREGRIIARRGYQSKYDY